MEDILAGGELLIPMAFKHIVGSSSIYYFLLSMFNFLVLWQCEGSILKCKSF